jgi:signal transduction histidine kinase
MSLADGICASPLVRPVAPAAAAASAQARRAATLATAGGLLACVIVGASFAVSAEIAALPHAFGQALRYGAAAILLTVVLRGRLGRPARADAVRLAGVAAFGAVGFNLCLVAAVERADPAMVGVIIGCAPLVLAALGGGRPDRRLLGAAAIVVAGAALVQGAGDSGGTTGLALAFGALACECLFSLLAVSLLPKLGALRFSAHVTWMAAAMFALLTVAELGQLRAPDRTETAALAFLALLPTALAFVLWYGAVQRLGVGRAGLLVGLMPVAALATSVLLGLQTGSPEQLAGVLLVAVGVTSGLWNPPTDPASADRAPRHGSLAARAQALPTLRAAEPLGTQSRDRSAPLDAARPAPQGSRRRDLDRPRSRSPRAAADHVPDTRRAEIEASRARIVAAADDARKRLERDLHDGAQQRFVLASLLLGRAAAGAHGTPAEPLVAEALEQVHEGLAELRDLAHGLHPAVLSERGLAAALERVAGRSSVPVELRVTHEHVAPALEAAIYFTAAEALTNAAKHAHATRARVVVDVADGTLTAEIADDGIGGANPTVGSGLRGLADRLDAIGGTLTVNSPRGGGTVVRAHAPCPRPCDPGADHD